MYTILRIFINFKLEWKYLALKYQILLLFIFNHDYIMQYYTYSYYIYSAPQNKSEIKITPC